MAETHNDVIRDKHLPRVGDTVRSKKYKTLWRVIEKKEVWLNTSDDPETGDCRVIPAIYLFDSSCFGVRAYRHFLKPANGRNYLHAILAGKALAE